jgi:quercetin dioxygenase-like cupin family protein
MALKIFFEEELMKTTRIDRMQAKHDPLRANNFEGEVNFQSLVSSADSHELDLLNVSFSAGARTRPHIHQQDQVLYIIEGRGIVATETERQIVTPGDVILIPRETWHWHGATRTSAMSHISVMKRGQTDWTAEEKNWAAGYDE